MLTKISIIELAKDKDRLLQKVKPKSKERLTSLNRLSNEIQIEFHLEYQRKIHLLPIVG